MECRTNRKAGDSFRGGLMPSARSFGWRPCDFCKCFLNELIEGNDSRIFFGTQILSSQFRALK